MMIAASSDPLLLNWEKLPGCPVIPWTEDKGEVLNPPGRVGDPCLWREDEGYYALTGGSADGKVFEDIRFGLRFPRIQTGYFRSRTRSTCRNSPASIRRM